MNTVTNIPQPGEIWSFFDNRSIKRERLIMTQTPDGYVIGWMCHSWFKHQDNILLKIEQKVGTKDMYIDPRKITYWHTPNMVAKMSTIDTATLNKVKKACVDLLFPFMPVLEQDDELSKKVMELTIERDVYRDIVKNLMGGEAHDETETRPPQKVEEKTKSKARTKAQIAEDNKKKYLPKQAYIGVKLKAMKMSQTTLALMVGVTNTTISAWNAGIQPARWSKLDRVFPGIEAEANEWVKEQVKQNE